MAPPSLLGPPELYAQVSPPQPPPATGNGNGNGVVDQTLSNFNRNPQVTLQPPMGFTENLSENPSIDFYGQVPPPANVNCFAYRTPQATQQPPMGFAGNPCLDFYGQVPPPASANCFVDHSVSNFNRTPQVTPMGFTGNYPPNYLSSRNSCFDQVPPPQPPPATGNHFFGVSNFNGPPQVPLHPPMGFSENYPGNYLSSRNPYPHFYGQVPPLQPLPASSNRFVHHTVGNFNGTPQVILQPPMRFTENYPATYLSSRSSCFDQYGQVPPPANGYSFVGGSNFNGTPQVTQQPPMGFTENNSATYLSSDIQVPPPQPPSATGNSFVGVSNLNGTPRVTLQPPMGLTENHSATYLSSGNPCLDFFFHIVPDTPSESLTQRLQLAWAHDPLTTLKLICNLRGVRGTGKSDKEGFHTAAFWLHKHHPKTLATNVAAFADFGYFKDLPEILYRILEGSAIRQNQKREWEQLKRGVLGHKGRKSKKQRIWISHEKQARSSKAAAKEKSKKEKATPASKAEKKIAMAKKVIEKYSSDSDFRFLYEQISDYFADCLRKDIKLLNSGESNKISLAGKWCPSIDSSFDRATLICESIAKKVFPREEYTEYEGIKEAHYLYRVRDRLRKDVLVPIHKALELPEVFIGDNRWDILPYNRVASLAMKFYKKKFLKHDSHRFAKYLEDVKSGKAKIAAGALLPHEIVMSLDDYDGGEVAELQWKRMVDDLLQKGKLNNCMAICDVSGSMKGTPMEVSIALGVLVSELTQEPWKGKLITFSSNPQLQRVEGDDLESKIQFVKCMEWGMTTDFQKVFDLILQVAVNGNLKEDEMIKKLFVFSDMEFNLASPRPWETDYQVIVSKFTEKGYGSAVPEIVFWNLRDSRATPVPGSQNGVALVSGFSKNLMKIFLDGDGKINPVAVMETAIAGDEYQKLVVVD